MSYYIPPSTSQCSTIRSRHRTGADLPEAYSSVRSVRDLIDQEYCDPHDPCCVNRDPEVFLQESVLRQSTRKVCPPKNPIHFEYNIMHRLKLRRILIMAAERQQNEELTPEQLEDIRRLEEEEDASKQLQPQVTASRAMNLKVSSKPETEPPGPPGMIEADPRDLQTHLQGLTNLALTHEIALNKDFKLKKMQEVAKPTKGEDESSLMQQIQLAQDAKDRYWVRVDHVLLKKDLKNYKHVVVDVLSTMKTALMSTILPHNWTMREKIDQELNMRRISKQIDGDAFDFGYYVDFLLDTLSALCCPIRDKEIVDIRDIPLVSKQLRKILDLVDTINMDMANFVLSQSRAHTMQSCIMYERNKFANYVEAQYRVGRDPLRITRDWIRRQSIPDRPFSEAMAHAFLEVLEWEDDKEWPETLALDWHRFPAIREEILRVTVIGTIVTCVYEYALTLLMDSAVEANEGFEKEQLCLLKNLRLMSKLREELNPLLLCEDLKDPQKFQEQLRICGEVAARIVDEHREAELCIGIQETEKLKIQQIIMPLFNLNHDVRKTYYENIKQWFLELAAEDGRAPILTPQNLKPVGPLVVVPITEMMRLTMYNRGVFDVLYREIFEGNCGPPTMYPSSREEEDPNETVVLDANKYGQVEEDDIVMDETIVYILAKLRGFKMRSMVYRRSRVDPRTKPMFESDGTPIIPPERQPEYVPKQLTAIEQKHLDEYILAHEPTLEEDYDGVYNFQNIGEPDWMFGYTTEQLLQIMERENLINLNKLKRIKERMNQEVLQQRVADNLPVFFKLWGKGFGGLAKEFCRLQRIYEKGALKLPPGATDEPSGRRDFPPSCQPPPPPPPELPKFNEKGEKLIYPSEGKNQFGVTEALPPQKCEFDFEGVAKALADVKEVDPAESFLNQPNVFARAEEESALDKLLGKIPKPDPHWRMLDFKIRIPKRKSNRFKWSRMMESMSKIHGNSPNSPINQFARPTQRPTPSFTSTWAPPAESQIYTGARSKLGFGGDGAPTSNQTVVQMAIPLMVGKTAIIAKADKPQMPATSDIAPAHTHIKQVSKKIQGGQKKSIQSSPFGNTMVRFPMVPEPTRQLTTFDPRKKRRMPISERQKLMMAQQESRLRGNMMLRPPPERRNLQRKFSFDWRQGK